MRRTTSILISMICLFVGSATALAFTTPVRTAEEVKALLGTLKEVPYRSQDARALYRMEANGDGDRTNRFDACAGLYTPAADAKRRKVFDVSDFGALGTGASRRYGGGPTTRGGTTDDPDDGAQPFLGGGMASTDRPADAIEHLANLLGPEPGSAGSGAAAGGLEPKDEWDWIGIQAAIVAAHRAGGGIVVIPDSGSDYLVNRGIWLYSNVVLAWLTDPGVARHSRVRLIAPTVRVGSVIGPYNPYLPVTLPHTVAEARRDTRKAIENNRVRRSKGFVCRVVLIEPRVAAMKGENAVSFGLGSYGVHIVGGHLTGARFGTVADAAEGQNLQGGKALQFESGVQQVVVEGTRISDSTIGVSSSAGYFLKSRRSDPGRFERFSNASDRIFIRDVDIDLVELPFFFAGVADPHSAVAPQSVVVEGFRVRQSGLLQTPPAHPYPDEATAFQAGIFNLLAATDITVRKGVGGAGGVVENDFEIGSLVRGFGEQVHIADVRIGSPVRALVDMRTALGRLASKPTLKNVSLVSTSVRQMPQSILRAPQPHQDRPGPQEARNVLIDVTVLPCDAEGHGPAAHAPDPRTPGRNPAEGARHLHLRID